MGPLRCRFKTKQTLNSSGRRSLVLKGLPCLNKLSWLDFTLRKLKFEFIYFSASWSRPLNKRSYLLGEITNQHISRILQFVCCLLVFHLHCVSGPNLAVTGYLTVLKSQVLHNGVFSEHQPLLITLAVRNIGDWLIYFSVLMFSDLKFKHTIQS